MANNKACMSKVLLLLYQCGKIIIIVVLCRFVLFKKVR